jgi:putative transposase
MSRQNYYGQRRVRAREQVAEALVVALVRQERQRQPRLGGRKLWRLLREELAAAGMALGRDRFFGVLRRQELLIRRRKRGCRTTDSRHGWRVYRNLAQDLVLTGPHQLWVSDITYVRTEEGFMYLALVMDAYSRKIVGADCSDSLEAEGARRALRMALRQLPVGARKAGRVHHSDRGVQYCCGEYVALAEGSGLVLSMTEENHCYENAQAERLNGILKQEYGLGEVLATKAEAVRLVRQAVALYNGHRPHAALRYAFPEQVHELGGGRGGTGAVMPLAGSLVLLEASVANARVLPAPAPPLVSTPGASG